MTLNEWLGVGVASVTLISAFGLGVRFLVKYYLSELLPDSNGGHNLRGKVDRIEQRLDTLMEILLDK
jgi:hypothetical protein